MKFLYKTIVWYHKNNGSVKRNCQCCNAGFNNESKQLQAQTCFHLCQVSHWYFKGLYNTCATSVLKIQDFKLLDFTAFQVGLVECWLYCIEPEIAFEIGPQSSGIEEAHSDCDSIEKAQCDCATVMLCIVDGTVLKTSGCCELP